MRSVGTAVRRKPENVRSGQLEHWRKTLADERVAGGVDGLLLEETD